MVNELLRHFDTMTGVLIALDNGNRNPSLTGEAMKAIEEIRGLIKNAEKS